MGRAFSVATLPILSVYQPEANSQESAKESYLSSLWFISWLLAFIKKKSKLTLYCLFYTFVLSENYCSCLGLHRRSELVVCINGVIFQTETEQYISGRVFQELSNLLSPVRHTHTHTHTQRTKH